MRIFAGVFLFLAVMSLAAGAWAANPFVTPKKDLPDAAVAPVVARGPMAVIVRLQSGLRQKMASLAQKIKADPGGGAFWMLMILSFAYGAIHSLGPGHGKILAVSYFLNRSGPLSYGFFFGQLAMFVHVFSAACLVFGAKYVLEKSMSMTVDQYGPKLEMASYALLVVLGIFLIIRTVREFRSSAAVDGRADKEAETGKKGVMALALACGIVPCPAATLILVFSISLGITVTGIFSLVFISLGMGTVISSVSIMAILSQKGAARMLSADNAWARGAYSGLCLAGALGLVCFGGLLLLGRLAGTGAI